jgi:hypothetical protein
MLWFTSKTKTNVIQQNNVIEYTKEQKGIDSYYGAVLNAVKTMSRRFSSGVFGTSPDGKRNYNELFGYGDHLTFSDYYKMYKRGGIAGTVVSKLPKSCWRDAPEIRNGETRILEKELLKLKKFGFFRVMERADILNRIGSFSIFLLGVPDGEDLDKPVGSARKDNFRGMYFRAYNYDGIEIASVDSDPASIRYGLPVLYQLQVVDIDGSNTKMTVRTSLLVHFSRVVHMAEGCLDNDIEGMSALQQPWNAVMDKEKVRGSSGESYYRNSRQKLALETNEGAKLSTDKTVIDNLNENVKNFQDGFEDTLRLNNMKANMLQPSMASPRDPFDICVEEIAGTTGIPVRILTTKAGGTVTGSEDKSTWNALVKDRQDQECTFYLLGALQVMAEAGILDLPEDADVVWPEQSALSESESAEASKNKSEAFKAVVDGLSTMGADEVQAKSVFDEVGLDGIEVEELDLSLPDDNNVDKKALGNGIDEKPE